MQTHFELRGGPRNGEFVEVWEGHPSYQWTFGELSGDDWSKGWTPDETTDEVQHVYQLRGAVPNQHYEYRGVL